MEFESLPTTPRAEELVDTAFSRAARAGRAKSGVDAQASMLRTASNVLSDNLENVVTSWPDFDALDPFYDELADALVDVDETRKALSEVGWAARKTRELGREYEGRVRGKSPDSARSIRQQGFARMASVVDEVEADLARLGEGRDVLRRLPDIRPTEPTVVIAGYPNVGKSSLVNAVTNARNEVAEYPFTTTKIRVGHVERDHVRYQLVDTPGLLDRPMADRNDIERQAVSALTHVADAILFLVDASETCGYELDVQLALRDDVQARFAAPIVTACNKADLSTAVEADYYLSVTQNDAVAGRRSADDRRVVSSVDEVLDAVIEATGFEPSLPFEETGSP